MPILHHHRLRPHHHENMNPPKLGTNPRKLFVFLLKCIIMACILSLFLLFLGFAALVLLHFLFITTAFRHRRGSRSSAAAAAADVTVVNLPQISYNSSSAQSATSDCAICLEGFREGEPCRSLPACGHLFHMTCVDSWLTKVPNCPVCRAPVRLGSQESGSMMSDDDWKIWWAVGG